MTILINRDILTTKERISRLMETQTALESYQQAISFKINDTGIVEDIRTKREFLIGYRRGSATAVAGYASDISMKQLVALFNDVPNLQQKGALAWEIEHRALKLSFKPGSEKFSRLFREIAGTPQQGDFDRQANQQLAPQGLLLNLSEDGFGGHSNSLSKLMLVAKQLESKGQIGVASRLLEQFYAVAAITNSPDRYSEVEQNNASSMINSLQVINTHTLVDNDALNNTKYDIVNQKWSLADNNAMTLQQVLGKLILEGSSSPPPVVLLELETLGHVMSAWSKAVGEDRIYGFYDPNAGMVEFSSAGKFKAWMTSFFGKLGLNMTQEYQLTRNMAGESIFHRVTEFNGDHLANFKPYNVFSNQTTLKDIVLKPVFNQPVLSKVVAQIPHGYTDVANRRSNSFNDVMFSGLLRIDLSTEGRVMVSSYNEIIASLDKLHTPSDNGQVDTAFMLKNQIQAHIKEQPHSAHNVLLSRLEEQINQALFGTDMEPARVAINQVAETRPALATRLYHIACNEAQGYRSGLTDFMVRWVNEDPYLKPARGFIGEVPDKIHLGFDATFHIALGEQFNNFKSWLVQAQAEGVMSKAYLNEATQSVHLGYGYQELTELAGNDKAQMVVYLLKQAARDTSDNGVARQPEEVMLNKFADKDYILRLQEERLTQIEQIYDSNHNTDIEAWDKQYSASKCEQLNQQLNQQSGVSAQLAILLEDRKGLLISELHGTDLNGQRFIIEHMDALKAQGITTIGLEHLRRELAQPLINDYLATGRMSGDLRAMVKGKSLELLFAKAYEKGMKIVALDAISTARTSTEHGLMYRAGAANNVAVEILNRLPADEKFIAIYGESHLKSHKGVDSFLPGISHRMGLPILKVDSNNRFHVANDNISERKIYDDTADSPRIIFNPWLAEPEYPVSLVTRIHRTIAILDALVAGELGVTTLSYWQRRAIGDFFQTMDGKLDVRQLLTTVTNSDRYYQVRGQLQDLMQMGDAHHQFDGLSGQEAWQRSARWHKVLYETGAILHQAARKYTKPGINGQVFYIPQGVYIGDTSPMAKQSAANLGLAWLCSLSQGDPEHTLWLNGLYAHAEIYEQKVGAGISALEAQQAEQFRRSVNELNNTGYADRTLFTDQGQHELKPWLQQLQAAQDGYYQLVANKHVLTLAKRSVDGESIYYFYDPDLGELRFSGDDPVKVISAFESTLNDYLRSQHGAWGNQQLADHYGVQQQGNQFKFHVYQLDTTKAGQIVPLNQLQQLLQSGFSTELRRMQHAGNVTIGDITLPWQTLYEMGVTVDGYRVSSGLNLDARQLRFDTGLLIPYLTAETTTPQQAEQVIRLLKQQIAQTGKSDGHLLTFNIQPHHAAVARQLVDLLNGQIDSSGIKNSLNNNTDTSRRLHLANRITGTVGRTTQGVMYLKTLIALSNYWRQRNSDQLSAQQKYMLDREISIASAGLLWSAGSEITEWGLVKKANRLTQHATKRIAAGLPPFGSRLSSIRYNLVSKLAKWGGPVLGIAGSGFDIFNAWRSFSSLSTETDAKIRTDLQVNGGLATAGAAVGIATALAIAAGGTAAAVGGPLGIAAGLLIGLSGGIYAAARQIADIKQYVELSAMQELRNGWLLFWGKDPDAEIVNAITYQQTLEQGRKEYDLMLAERAETLLASSGIDILYYSHGEIRLQEHTYKRLRARQAIRVRHEIGYVTSSIIKDKIKPEDAAVWFDYYDKLTLLNERRYIEMELEESEYKYYLFQKPQDIDDTANVSEHANNAVKALFIGQRQRVGQLIDDQDKALDITNAAHHGMLMGDFNGDGYRDIGYFSLKGVYILLADQRGGYGRAQRIKELQGIFNLRCLVVDINHDGRDDVIILSINAGRGEMTTLLTHGGSNFTAISQQIPQALSHSGDEGLVAGDIDGDSYADLISLNDHRIDIYYGSQLGFNIAIKKTWIRPCINSRIRSMAGDVNGDGHHDVVLLTSDGKIHTLLGNQDRQKKLTEVPEQNYPEADMLYRGTDVARDFKPSQLQLYDMNGDGRADLIAIKNDGSYSISLGQTDGTFGPIIRDGQREENGQTVFYRQNRLAVKGESTIIGIAMGKDGQPALLSFNKKGEINAHPFGESQIKDTTAWFRLGDGNDVVVGHDERKNLFEVAGGTKRFTGGRYADSFLLMGQPTPELPGELDGGEDPASLKPLEDNDIVVATVKPVDGRGYVISLADGYAMYQHETKYIATLRHIEHVQGHSETNDFLIGDGRDNHLNGAGGFDVLIGNEGNDVLTLQAGNASGGAGIDSYHILQKSNSASARVELTETDNLQESSNILLDYNAEQITAITVENNDDVILTLLNDNNSHTLLVLKSLYQTVNPDQVVRLKHNYILYTRDGLMVTGWPYTLSRNVDGTLPVPLLTAQYKPELDRGWQQRIQSKKSEEITLYLQGQNSQGQGRIKIAESSIVLPEFIQLDTRQTVRSSQSLLGNRINYVTVGSRGKDFYQVGDKENNDREMVIDNDDDSPETDHRSSVFEQDLLLLPLPVEQIHLEQSGADIVLSHRDEPQQYPTVRIRHFMTDERHRHLSLMDKNGWLYDLNVGATGAVLLGQLQIGNGDDYVVLYNATRLTGNTLNALAGNDQIIDKSGGNHTLRGGNGNDILLTDSGNNILYGDAGQDKLYGGTGNDLIIGGEGDDELYGGDGDDIYLFASGDGQDSITESHGFDTLKFISTEISREKIWLAKEGNNLRIWVNGPDSADSVLVQNYYSHQKYKIEVIKTAQYELRGSDIDKLADAMAAFTFSEGLVSPSLQAHINNLWLTASTEGTVANTTDSKI